MNVKIVFLWLPLIGSLANFVPLTKYHWIFEFNREFFFFYLCHHLLSLLFLWGRWGKNKIPSLLALLLGALYIYSIKLPPLFPGLFKAEGTQISLQSIPAGLQVKPREPQYDYEIDLVANGAGKERGNIHIQGKRNFIELSELDPGVGIRVGQIRTAAGDITLAIVNIDVPWSKKGIFDRKVLLRRLNSIFRHPYLKTQGPKIVKKKARLNFASNQIIIVGNFGAASFTWDIQQFWQEDNFEVTPLRWSAALGLPGSSRLFLASRGVKGLVIDALKDQILMSIPPN